MLLVTKYQKHEIPEIIRTLSDQEKLDILKFFGPNRNLQPVDRKQRTQALLRNMWDNELWMTCFCQQEDMSLDPPILAPRKERGGGYTLVRLKHRAYHSTACVFAKDQDDVVVVKRKKTRRSLERWVWDVLHISGQLKVRFAENAPYDPKNQIKKMYQALKRGAIEESEYVLADGSNLVTGFQWAEGLVKKIREKKIEQGIVIGIVDHWSGTTLHAHKTEDKQIEPIPMVRLDFPREGLNLATGPFLAVAKVEIVSGFPQMVVFLTGVAGRNLLIPVNGEQKRELAWGVVKMLRALSRDTKKTYTLKYCLPPKKRQAIEHQMTINLSDSKIEIHLCEDHAAVKAFTEKYHDRVGQTVFYATRSNPYGAKNLLSNLRDRLVNRKL